MRVIDRPVIRATATVVLWIFAGCAPAEIGGRGQDPAGVESPDMPADEPTPQPPAAPPTAPDAGAPPDARPTADAGRDQVVRDAGTPDRAHDAAPSAPAPPQYDPVRAKKLADTAYALWNGKPSMDLCLKGVGDSAERSGIIPNPPGWLRLISADAFERYYNSHPAELARRGFVRQNIAVGKVPRGAIIGWRPGQCGYHPVYGHIEIVVDDTATRACSDYCGLIKRNCGDPYVYVPIKL